MTGTPTSLFSESIDRFRIRTLCNGRRSLLVKVSTLFRVGA